MKSKLSLKTLEVKSFVTNLEAAEQLKLKGGTLNLSKLPTMPCNCSAIDACITAQACGI